MNFDDFLTELKKKKVDIKARRTQELLKKEFDGSLIKIDRLIQKITIIDDKLD